MSHYTTEVRFICEHLAGLDESVGYDKIDEVIDASWDKLFDFTFPIFEESYREGLIKKIIRHYYTREIGAETVGRWKLFLRTTMDEIMPYFNQLYKSAQLDFQPFYDADYTREGTKDNTRTNDLTGTRTDNLTRTNQASGSDSRSDTANQKQNTWDLYSDTPQGGIRGLEGTVDDSSLGENAYLTNARHVIGDTNGSTASSTATYGRLDTARDTGTQTNTTEGTVVDDGEYFERVRGKFPGKSYSELLEEYRKTFLNIDMMVIDALKDLFLNLW